MLQAIESRQLAQKNELQTIFSNHILLPFSQFSTALINNTKQRSCRVNDDEAKCLEECREISADDFNLGVCVVHSAALSSPKCSKIFRGRMPHSANHLHSRRNASCVTHHTLHIRHPQVTHPRSCLQTEPRRPPRASTR